MTKKDPDIKKDAGGTSVEDTGNTGDNVTPPDVANTGDDNANTGNTGGTAGTGTSKPKEATPDTAADTADTADTSPAGAGDVGDTGGTSYAEDETLQKVKQFQDVLTDKTMRNKERAVVLNTLILKAAEGRDLPLLTAMKAMLGQDPNVKAGRVHIDFTPIQAVEKSRRLEDATTMMKQAAELYGFGISGESIEKFRDRLDKYQGAKPKVSGRAADYALNNKYEDYEIPEEYKVKNDLITAALANAFSSIASVTLGSPSGTRGADTMGAGAKASTTFLDYGMAKYEEQEKVRAAVAQKNVLLHNRWKDNTLRILSEFDKNATEIEKSYMSYIASLSSQAVSYAQTALRTSGVLAGTAERIRSDIDTVKINNQSQLQSTRRTEATLNTELKKQELATKRAIMQAKASTARSMIGYMKVRDNHLVHFDPKAMANHVAVMNMYAPKAGNAIGSLIATFDMPVSKANALSPYMNTYVDQLFDSIYNNPEVEGFFTEDEERASALMDLVGTALASGALIDPETLKRIASDGDISTEDIKKGIVFDPRSLRLKYKGKVGDILFNLATDVNSAKIGGNILNFITDNELLVKYIHSKYPTMPMDQLRLMASQTAKALKSNFDAGDTSRFTGVYMDTKTRSDLAKWSAVNLPQRVHAFLSSDRGSRFSDVSGAKVDSVIGEAEDETPNAATKSSFAPSSFRSTK